MRKNRSVPDATVIPVLTYSDVRAAVAWLTDTFGFAERVRIGDDHRSQLQFGDGAVIVADVGADRTPPRSGEKSHSVLVRVEDANAHCERARAGGARIVSLSSRGHLRSPVIFDDLNFTVRPYDPWLAYGQSKTANVLFAVEATKRWASDGITANAVHPGAIAATNLSRHMDPGALAGLRASGMFSYKTIEQGAATSVLVATSPLLESVGGRYFEDCHEAVVLDPGAAETSGSGVAPYALDPEAAARLWRVSADALAG